jgi:hypothetical protein
LYLELLPLLETPAANKPETWAFSLSYLPVEQRIWLLNQAKARKQIRQKLPNWVHPQLVFPPAINLQQSSSQLTAEDKTELILGNTVVDLTGGFGVDTITFAKAGFSVTHVEPNAELQQLCAYNASILVPDNPINFVNLTAEEFLTNNPNLSVDTIYLDPSRRSANQEKVIRLEEYEPNLVSLYPTLFSACKRIIVKVSPMLDLSYVRSLFDTLTSIRVTAVKNECKEVLLVLDNKKNEVGIALQTRNYESSGVIQEFSIGWVESKMNSNSGVIDDVESYSYLFDVNNAIHKAQLYSEIESAFNIRRIAAQTHVFFGKAPIEHFPGRSYRIKQLLPYKKSTLLGNEYNIVPRNFPDSEENIRKKLNIKKNGILYLYAVSDSLKKPVLIECEPVI